MREQMKNYNEFREDGNLYVKKIRSCRCVRKTGQAYILTCEIHQRGEHEYRYEENTGYMVRNNRKLWLDEEAAALVCETVKKFEEFLSAAEADAMNKTVIEKYGLTLLYNREGEAYNLILKYNAPDSGECVINVVHHRSLPELIHKFNFHIHWYYKIKDLFICGSEEELSEHPFIICAREHGDALLEKQVRVYYGLASPKDCADIAEALGRRILPKLSKAFDRNYYIDASTVHAKEYEMLERSGFVILHRPYFAMKGSTHSKMTINPYTGQCVDAAKEDADTIPFKEFLKLFDDERNYG